jgi:hypothetical protein
MDLVDTVRVIGGYRKERFAHERAIALITFGTWLHYPHNSQVVDAAAPTAASLLLAANSTDHFPWHLSQKETARIASEFFQPLQIAQIIRRHPLEGGYRGNVEFQLGALTDVSSVVLFLVRCPAQFKPSLNKAFDFIRRGGFEDSPGEYRPSRATLKKSWASHSAVSAFAAALDILEQDWILGLAADDSNSLKAAHRFSLKDAREFLSLSLQLQKITLEILNTQRKNSIQGFPDFPDVIPPSSEEFFPLETEQLEIVGKYKAPSAYRD